PPDSSRRMKQDLRFRCHLNLFDASTTHARPRTKAERFLERLPDPYLTGSSPAFSPNARHDGLQPTQHRGGLTPTPAGPTPEGQQASISRTAPLYGVLPTSTSSNVRDTRFSATTGRSAGERLNRYSMPPVSAVGTLPLAARRTDPQARTAVSSARLLTFRARAADQAHAASTPGTTWPG